MKIKEFLNDMFSSKSAGIKVNTQTGQPYFWSKNYNYWNGWNKVDEQTLLSEAYAKNPYVFMVVDDIAESVSRLKVKFIDKDSQTEVEIPDDLKELLMSPNQRDTFESFYYRLACSYLVTGNAFTVGTSSVGFNQYSELEVPTSPNVTINEDSRGLVNNYSIQYFNGSLTAEKERVLHILKPDVSCDNLRGISPLQAGAKVWQSNNEVWESEAFLHKNKGINGILYGDGNRILNPTEQKEIQAQYDRDSSGAENFGKVRVSSSKLGFLKMGMNPTDLKSIESDIRHLRAICSLYSVDSKLFGDSASSTFNNMAEAKQSKYTEAVLPLAEEINACLSKWLIQDNFDLNVEMIVDTSEIPILNKPNLELSNMVLQQVQAGILSVEEAREILHPEL